MEISDDAVYDEELRVGWYAERIYLDQVILDRFAFNKVHVITSGGVISDLGDNFQEVDYFRVNVSDGLYT